MTFHFGNASQRRLDSCHRDIQVIVTTVLAESNTDLTVADGKRDEEAQQKAFDGGFSKAKFGQSPHNHEVKNDGGCPAVDLVPYIDGALAYDNDAAFTELADLVRAVNIRLLEEGTVTHTLVWGNDWDNDGVEVENDPDESFVDKPHWQLEGWKELV